MIRLNPNTRQSARREEYLAEVGRATLDDVDRPHAPYFRLIAKQVERRRLLAIKRDEKNNPTTA